MSTREIIRVIGKKLAESGLGLIYYEKLLRLEKKLFFSQNKTATSATSFSSTKLYDLNRVCLGCFSTFFDSRHPSFLIEQFLGTPSYNLPVNRLTSSLYICGTPRVFHGTQGLRGTPVENPAIECLKDLARTWSK